jgi:Flp pilus assembly pilin Flp
MRMSSVERAARTVRSLLADDEGQDVIEYALLAGLVAVAGAMLFPAIRDSMAAVYQSWNTNAQDIWQPPPPM